MPGTLAPTALIIPNSRVTSPPTRRTCAAASDILPAWTMTSVDGPTVARPVRGTKNSPASTSAVSDQYHQVSAYVDCGPDGAPPDGPEQNDAVIIYRGPGDHVVYGDGYWGGGGNERPTAIFLEVNQYAVGGPEGERPLDALDRVEWGMPFADLDVLIGYPYETYGFPPYDPNCGPGSEARVRFYTYKVTSGGQYECGYDETDWAGFDIPTVVELNSLSAQSTSGVDRLAVSAAALLGAAAVGGLGLLLIHKRKQSA